MGYEEEITGRSSVLINLIDGDDHLEYDYLTIGQARNLYNTIKKELKTKQQFIEINDPNKKDKLYIRTEQIFKIELIEENDDE